MLEWFKASGGQEAALASFSITKLPYLEGSTHGRRSSGAIRGCIHDSRVRIMDISERGRRRVMGNSRHVDTGVVIVDNVMGRGSREGGIKGFAFRW